MNVDWKGLLQTAIEAATGFTFYYPLFMSYLWMSGALFYWLKYERRPFPDVDRPPPRTGLADADGRAPLVAILVPCFNEEDNAEETIAGLMNLAYPNYEVIAINDGSKDRTGEILDRLVLQYPKLRVIHHEMNQGKAVGLNTATLLTRAEFVVGIDGDAVLDRHAIDWLIWHFRSPRVGAVTGNPRIRTRSTLLGRLQVGEFSSIVGLIKRAQRTYGKIFTVSGVVTAFRRTALHQVGYWTPDALTEDVDVSWKLQLAHWDIRFEPKALCWILMPETLRGLWKQRLRWATGGVQALMRYRDELHQWRHRRMWPVFSEYMLSVVWSYLMLAVLVGGIAMWVLGHGSGELVDRLGLRWAGVIIGTTCLLQIIVSMKLDSRYDRGLGRYFFWMIWYPLAYWMLNMATAVVALPKALRRETGKRATWTSPDRGLGPTAAR